MTRSQPDRLNQIEATLATHNEILSQLAPLAAQVTQLLTRTAERGDTHSQEITEIREIMKQNAEALTNHDESLSKLEQRMNQLVELVTTSTTETMRLVADLSRQVATNNTEIREIWQYLRYEPGNGR